MADMPWPGDELAWRVSNCQDRDAFVLSGRLSVEDLQATLALVGRHLATYESILDFGCGCGRILLWLREVAQSTTLHGTDIDERAIAWCQGNISYASCRVNEPLPPLPYDDGSFDLVFSNSVFTHIDEQYQDRWLEELHRVTRPGGHVALTVHGEHAFVTYEASLRAAGRDAGAVRQELSRDGISFIRDDGFAGGPFPDFYHSTFHTPWYVFEHWGRYFTIAAYVCRRSLDFQDYVLLERRPDGASTRGEPITVARGSTAPAPASSLAAGSGSDPLHRAGELLHRGVDRSAPAGHVTRLAVRLLEKALRTRHGHQRAVDEALFTALWELDATVASRTMWGGVPVTELNARAWEAIRQQGLRMNRLEADLRNPDQSP